MPEMICFVKKKFQDYTFWTFLFQNIALRPITIDQTIQNKKCFMVTQCSEGARYLSSLAFTSDGYKTDINFNNIIATLSFYFDSSVKNSPANVIKVLAAILKLVCFTPFD